MSQSHSPNVLVVDDYSTMRRILRQQLLQIGFPKVAEATDGDQAWNYLQSNAVHLIISDWNMEPVSGLELLKRVRAEEKTKAIPFIMVTAEARPENVVTAKRAGVSNYIVKPFNADTLRMKIAGATGVA